MSIQADYTIDLLDPEAPNGTPVRSFSGNTSTGEIQVLWDGRDQRTGLAYVGDMLLARFSVTTSVGPQIWERYLHRSAVFGLGDGTFTIAYSYNIPSWVGPGNALHGCIQSGVVDPLLQPTTVSYYNPYRYTSAFNIDTVSDPTGSGNPGWIDESSPSAYTREQLLSNLEQPETRHFYWYGHGEVDRIHGPAEEPILFSDIADRLENSFSWLWAAKTSHPFRFVFLDACLTGSDLAAAHAFGMPKTIKWNVALQYPEKLRAFIGYNERTGAVSPTLANEYRKSLFIFFSMWQQDYPLGPLARACTRKKPFDGTDWELPTDHSVELEYPLGADPGNPPTPIPRRLVIYGYERISRLGSW